MTFGNCFSPFNGRQVFDAAMISLNTISLAVADERAGSACMNRFPRMISGVLDHPSMWLGAGRCLTGRQFADEFKLEAVGLLASSGRPLSQIAQGMGIAASRLRACWNRDDKGHPGSPQPGGDPAPARNWRLKTPANERLRMEREILKKNAAHFLGSAEMKFRLKAHASHIELRDCVKGSVQTHEMITGSRPTNARTPKTIRLTLAEGKSFLAAMQTHLVQAQADKYCIHRRTLSK
jgi:transposase